MQTMNISLPDQLKEFVDDQVGSGRYSSVSEYVRELIRDDNTQNLFVPLWKASVDDTNA